MARWTPILFACAVPLALIAALTAWMITSGLSGIALAASNSYVVNSTADAPDADTGDGVFQILASAHETSLSGLTIRNGKKVANTFDQGDDLACPLIDQRGYGRIRGGHCDIGAVEYFELSRVYLPILSR